MIPLFLKMLYNLVLFLSLHVKLVLVQQLGQLVIYEVTANTSLANTETLSLEKMKGSGSCEPLVAADG